MARKIGAKGKKEPALKYGTAVVVVRWPYLATENLQVTVDYQGYKMLLQVLEIDIVPTKETVKGNGTIQ